MFSTCQLWRLWKDRVEAQKRPERQLHSGPEAAEETPKRHPPDPGLSSGTCLRIPTGLPSRSLQMLHTLGPSREQGPAADLHHSTSHNQAGDKVTSQHMLVLALGPGRRAPVGFTGGTS